MTRLWKSLTLASSLLLAPACIDTADVSLGTDTSAIVGGTAEDIKDVPFTVALLSDGHQFCAGTILDARHVLTARHCLTGPNKAGSMRGLKTIQVAAGVSRLSQVSTDAQVVPVDDGFPLTDDYDGTDILSGRDVVVIRLARPLHFNRRVQPVTLATPADERAGRLRPGVVATTVGWGLTAEGGEPSDQLLTVDLPIVSHDELERVAGKPVALDTIAAGGEAGKDSCNGDSGGPLLVKKGHSWIQAGLVSFGLGDDEHCARAGEPAVYGSVPTYVDLIREAMREQAHTIARKDRLDGKEGDVLFFEVRVPPHQHEVNFHLFGAAADLDLRVKKGARPTEDDFDCKSSVIGRDSESCNYGDAAPGTYWVRIDAFEDFQGAKLLVNGYNPDDCDD